jgi:hypothetical protein
MSLRTIVNIFALAFCVHMFASLITPVCPSCLALRESISDKLVGPNTVSWTAWATAWDWVGLIAAIGVGVVGVWLIDRRKGTSVAPVSGDEVRANL